MKSAIASAASRAGSLPLVGNALALDFANTESGRGTATHRDHLLRAEHVVAWARHAAVLTAPDSEKILRGTNQDPRLAAKLKARARGLRDLVYTIAFSVASRREPEARDMQRLTRFHAACLAQAQLKPARGRFDWTWNAADTPVEAVLGPITLSALALLTETDPSRLKQCRGNACGWLFFDVTKNKGRRWCEMEVCGNRAKQRRFHERQHRESGE